MEGNRVGCVRWWRLVLAVLALFGLIAAACGDDDDSATSSSEPAEEPAVRDAAGGGDFDATAADDGASDGGAEESAAEEPAAEEPADAELGQGSDDQGEGETGGGGDAGSPETPTQLDPTSLGRQIIYVASVEVTVDDVALASSQAKTAIAGLGGLLFGEDTQTGDRNRTVLEFKVLPEDFQEALARLEGLGNLESQQVTADDVTERVVDLQSRIATAEVSVARLRQFLEGATDLEAIASLEAQLLQRETDLETLRGQLRTIQDQVDLATIFLTLRETAPPEVLAAAEFTVTFYEGADDGARCPGLEELEVDEGLDVTICVQIENAGNADLTEIELRDDRLDLRPRDFTFADAGNDEPLQPGEQVTAWATAEAPASGSSRIQPSAVAVDAEGNRLRVGVDFALADDYAIRFIEDDSLPGFVDALSGSWDFFKTVIGVVIILAGVLVPFIWVPFVLWGIREWWLRRQERRWDEANAAQQAPPTPTPEPVE